MTVDNVTPTLTLRIKELSKALRNVLIRDKVLNEDTEPTGPELLLAAEEYCDTKLITEQPYPEAIYLKYPSKCFWCSKLTHWADPDYEGFVCSKKCQEEISEDVKSRANA